MANDVRTILVDVSIVGLADLQFDHYYGAEQDPHDLDDKMYLDENGGLCIPSENVAHMFFGTFYASAINLVEKKMEWKKIAWQARALMAIEPNMIPILRDQKQIVHKKWSKMKSGRRHDPDAGLWIDNSLPRVKGGVVGGDQTKLRPTLKKPWSMDFQIRVIEEDASPVTVEKVKRWLETGGLKVGIGTHRPVYGRFVVTRWVVNGDDGNPIPKSKPKAKAKAKAKARP